MKGIEIELENDGNSQEIKFSRARNFSNFKEREVLLTIAGSRFSSLVKINSTTREGLFVSYPLGFFGYLFNRKERTKIIPYEDIKRAVLLNPKIGDELITREGYHSTTERTIDETVKWAKRGYRT